MNRAWRVLLIGLALVTAAVLGAAVGIATGVTLGEFVNPDDGFETLGYGIAGAFIGASLGVFAELAAVFKLPRVPIAPWLRGVGALVVVGIAAIGFGKATDGQGVITPLFIGCLPLGLLGALMAASQRLYAAPDV